MSGRIIFGAVPVRHRWEQVFFAALVGGGWLFLVTGIWQ